MRSPDLRHFRQRGFTLLELVLALSASGLLVALLVGVWIQVTHTASETGLEAARLRLEEGNRRTLRRILEGAQWSATSIAPHGTLPWREEGGGLILWSRDGLGASAGPGAWRLEARPGEGLVGQWQDPQSVERGERRWPEVEALRLEVLQSVVQAEGESLRWTRLGEMDPAQPFRPLGLRFWIRWKAAPAAEEEEEEECLCKLL